LTQRGNGWILAIIQNNMKIIQEKTTLSQGNLRTREQVWMNVLFFP
jgi:hypothetical protein